MDEKNPFRCWDRRYLLEAVAVALVIIALAVVGRGFAKGSAVRIAVGALQGAAFDVLIVRTALAVRKLDELQQRIHLVATAVSFTATGVLVVTAGFIEKAGVAVQAPGVWLWFFMLVVWGLAVSVLARRYR